MTYNVCHAAARRPGPCLAAMRGVLSAPESSDVGCHAVTMPRNYAKSASRALDLMAWFADVRRPAKSAEIADALGLPRSSADQLLKTLVHDGYLLRSSTGKTYLPSPRTAGFGRFLDQLYPEYGALIRLVETLHETTGEMATVAMINDCYMQVIAVNPREGEFPVELGYQVPIVGSAIGGAALTQRTRSEIEQIVGRAMRQRASFDTSVSTQAVLDSVQSYRMKGYSWQRREGETYRAGPGADLTWYAVAMPLTETRFPGVVIGLAGPAHRIQAQERDLVSLMRREIRRHVRGEAPQPHLS